ncbi:MAG TPA: HyaD/HybD family hydrogenase maturation endopeptidase [Candidatus Methylomirabilis sp.]|nr:HyaD/HybD family hydrogenase maturation endopeptidase [Candidatus Methylomirabilis sp.]
MKNKTLVLGIGNTLLGDEGAGVYAVRVLQERHADRADLELLDGGTLSFTLAGPIEEADNLIVIDATQLQDAPGTVRVFEGEDMDRFLGGHRKSSVHEVSLLDLLTVARLAEALPARRALIGIQPEYLDWSDTPTANVARAIPAACDLVMDLIERWRSEPGSRAPSGDASASREQGPREAGMRTSASRSRPLERGG